jgi:hypothetical protein
MLTSLKEFEKNVASQSGEDGIIEEIFCRIGIKHKICVEFGAWDGKYLSNTWNLWSNKGWKSILLEGNEYKYQDLLFNIKEFPNVYGLNVWVDSIGEHTLDKILEKVKIPSDFDLLSIDIDGDDYYIFESINKYRPRLIIIEFNHTIPPNLELVQEKGEYFGASALSLIKLASRKGYSPCYMTEGNIFFLVDEEFEKLDISNSEISQMFCERNITNVISAYDGRLFLTKVPTFFEFEKSEFCNQYKEKTILKLGKYSLTIKKKINKEYKSPLAGSSNSLIPIKIII